MKIYIARHYWKDNTNATWEYHNKIDKNLFEYLQNNYHNFTRDKPKIIKEHGFFIYPCYEDKKDIYDRNITNITFFISKKSISNDFCNSITPDILELEIAEKINFSLYLIMIGLLIVGLLSYRLYFNKTSSEDHNVTDQKIVQKDVSKLKRKKHEENKKFAKDIQKRKIKELEKFNQELAKYLKDNFPKKVTNKKDLDELLSVMNDLLAKRDNHLTSLKNKEEIKNLLKDVKNLRKKYKDLLEDGLCGKIASKVSKENKDFEIQDLMLNKQKCLNENDNYYCKIKYNNKIHFIKIKKLIHLFKINKLFPKDTIIDENKFIDEDTIIKIYNNDSNKSIKVEVKNGYYLYIKKVEKGRCNEKR